MNKSISMDDMIPLIKEKLDAGGKVEFTPRGFSMLPMLADNRDIVILKKYSGYLEKYDVPLYIRKNGSYVLHRVVGMQSDGTYIMCGDNQFIKEYGITDQDIIGIVDEFVRKGKRYRSSSPIYKAYYRIWYFILPLRKLYKITRHLLGKIKRKILKTLRNTV